MTCQDPSPVSTVQPSAPAPGPRENSVDLPATPCRSCGGKRDHSNWGGQSGGGWVDGGGAIFRRQSLSNYHWLCCAFMKKTRRGRTDLCVCVTVWTACISVYGCKVFLRWVLLLERHFEIKLDCRCKWPSNQSCSRGETRRAKLCHWQTLHMIKPEGEIFNTFNWRMSMKLLKILHKPSLHTPQVVTFNFMEPKYCSWTHWSQCFTLTPCLFPPFLTVCAHCCFSFSKTVRVKGVQVDPKMQKQSSVAKQEVSFNKRH